MSNFDIRRSIGKTAAFHDGYPCSCSNDGRMARLPRNVDTRLRFKAGTPIFINMAFKLNPLAFFERNDELNKMANNIGAFDNAFEKISFIA
jgi:hypothetical protein